VLVQSRGAPGSASHMPTTNAHDREVLMHRSLACRPICCKFG